MEARRAVEYDKRMYEAFKKAPIVTDVNLRTQDYPELERNIGKNLLGEVIKSNELINNILKEFSIDEITNLVRYWSVLKLSLPKISLEYQSFVRLMMSL